MWTDAMDSDLRRMFDQGLTFGEIGREMGITRNSAIGRAGRIGLPKRGPIVAKPKQPRKPRVHKRQRFREVLPIPNLNGDAASAGLCDITDQEAGSPTRPLPASTPAMSIFPTSQEGEKIDMGIENTCTLMDLTSQTCRWPLWSNAKPEHLYCGAPGADLENKLPYCKKHSAMAYAGRRG